MARPVLRQPVGQRVVFTLQGYGEGAEKIAFQMRAGGRARRNWDAHRQRVKCGRLVQILWKIGRLAGLGIDMA